MSKRFAILVNSYGSSANALKCLVSIRRHSNADDCTVVWIDASERAAGVDVFGVRYLWAAGASFSEAYNAGIRATQEPYVVLLADDVTVTAGWLEKLWQGLHLVHADYPGCKIGMVTPMLEHDAYRRVDHPEWRNTGPQLCEPFLLKSPQAEAPLVMGLPVTFFCNLIRREALEDLNLLDERFPGKGFCVDDDFQAALYLKGWQSVLQTDCLVGHVGQQGFGVRTPEENRRMHAESCELLEKKWWGRLDWSPYIYLVLPRQVRPQLKKQEEMVHG
jgi:GT2 family glycosyltransferase